MDSGDRARLSLLLGVYALDAVDDLERVAVDRFVATDAAARAELDRYLHVVELLTGTLEMPRPLKAPGPLVLPFSGERAAPLPTVPLPAPRLTVVPMSATTRQLGAPRWRRTLGAAVAAIVLIAAGLLAVRGFGTSSSSASASARAFGQAATTPGAHVSQLLLVDGDTRLPVVILPDGTGYLDGRTLQALPATSSYQLWGVSHDLVISLGVLGDRPGVESFVTRGSLPSELIVTREHRGGVAVSVQPPYASGAIA